MFTLGEKIRIAIERAYDDDKIEDTDLEFIEEKLYPWLCEQLGHRFELDHCCMAKHDFCTICSKRAVDLGYKRITNDYPQEWVKV